MNYPGKAAYFIVNSLLLLAFGVLSFGSQARVLCDSPYDQTTLIDYEEHIFSLDTGVMLTSARDLPIGSVIYRQSFRVPSTSRFLGLKGCRTNVDGEEPVGHAFVGFAQAIPGMPTGQHLNLNPIYSTGIEGIGYVALWDLHTANSSNVETNSAIKEGENAKSTLTFRAKLVTDEQLESGTGGSSGNGTKLLGIARGSISFLLVKTGPIPEGVWDIPVSLPPVVTNLSTYASEVGIDTFQKSQRFTFIPGSIKVVATTCQTPDVKVQLGSHHISDVIQAGYVTDWINFDIKLLNCPAMLGRYGYTQQNGFSYTTEPGVTSAIQGEPDGSLTIGAPNLLNTVRFSLNAINGASLNCAHLNPDEGSAEGICVNVLTKDTNERVINAGLIDAKLTLQNSPGSYAIPLKARYQRLSGETMKPGIANADVTFTINYQ